MRLSNALIYIQSDRMFKHHVDTFYTNLIENLMAKIHQMDTHLLQKLNNYASSLVDATTEQDNWWDLNEEDLREIEESERQIEAGLFVPVEEALEKYKKKYML